MSKRAQQAAPLRKKCLRIAGKSRFLAMLGMTVEAKERQICAARLRSYEKRKHERIGGTGNGAPVGKEKVDGDDRYEGQRQNHDTGLSYLESGSPNPRTKGAGGYAGAAKGESKNRFLAILGMTD